MLGKTILFAVIEIVAKLKRMLVHWSIAVTLYYNLVCLDILKLHESAFAGIIYRGAL